MLAPLSVGGIAALNAWRDVAGTAEGDPSRTAISWSDMLAAWWDRVAVLVAIAVPPTLGLAFLTLLVARRERELAEANAALEAHVARRTLQLRDSEARLRLAIDGAGAAHWDMDIGTGDGFWSERHFDMIGIPRDPNGRANEAVWFGQIHPDDIPAVDAAREKSLTSAEPHRAEYRIIRVDTGEVRRLLCYGQVLPGPRGPRSVGVMFDVTEERAEAARRSFLSELSDRLRAAEAPEAVLATATEALGRHLNAACTGYAEPEEGGEVAAIRHAWTAEGAHGPPACLRTGDYGALADALRDGRLVAVADIAADPITAGREPSDAAFACRALLCVPIHRGGRLAGLLFAGSARPRNWLASEAALLEEAAGRIEASLERSRADAALRRARAVLARDKEQLEALVVERTHDLQVTQARLAHAQKMEALGQLAGGIAHDFNNVMQAVAGGASLIRRRADDPRTVEHLARMVEEAAARGSSVTKRLLTFARRGELRAEAVDVPCLLQELQEVLAHTLGAGVAVRLDVPDAVSLPPILADRGSLETVLVNLATNARDAMPGGGTLILAAAEDIVTPGGAHGDGLRPGRYIRLSVVDTGEGMAPEVLARVSEPFFTTKPRGKGTGLGLATTRGFAEQSGGALAIRSTPGIGTTVSLWLPVASADARAEAPAPGRASSPAARLLIVDDEDLVREVVAAGLEEQGYTVMRSPDASAALAVLDAGARIDLILTDYAMPGPDGLNLIREARRRRPGLPAILLTGNAGDALDDADTAADGLLGGGFRLLRKPVRADELASAVADLVRPADP